LLKFIAGLARLGMLPPAAAAELQVSLIPDVGRRTVMSTEARPRH
jgi:hypothetical protein